MKPPQPSKPVEILAYIGVALIVLGTISLFFNLGTIGNIIGFLFAWYVIGGVCSAGFSLFKPEWDTIPKIIAGYSLALVIILTFGFGWWM